MCSTLQPCHVKAESPMHALVPRSKPAASNTLCGWDCGILLRVQRVSRPLHSMNSIATCTLIRLIVTEGPISYRTHLKTLDTVSRLQSAAGLQQEADLESAGYDLNGSIVINAYAKVWHNALSQLLACDPVSFPCES